MSCKLLKTPTARDASKELAKASAADLPAILKGEEQLTIAVPPQRKRGGRKRFDGPADPVFDILREARRKLAAEAGVPPYVIFHDSTLREIAARKPTNLNELGEVRHPNRSPRFQCFSDLGVALS